MLLPARWRNLRQIGRVSGAAAVPLTGYVVGDVESHTGKSRKSHPTGVLAGFGRWKEHGDPAMRRIGEIIARMTLCRTGGRAAFVHRCGWGRCKPTVLAGGKAGDGPPVHQGTRPAMVAASMG